MKIDFIKNHHNPRVEVGSVSNNVFSLQDVKGKLIATYTRTYCVEGGEEAKYNTISLKFDYAAFYGKQLDLTLLAGLIQKDHTANILFQDSPYKNIKPFQIVIDGKEYPINKFDNITGMVFNSFEFLNLSNELLQLVAKEPCFNIK